MNLKNKLLTSILSASVLFSAYNFNSSNLNISKFENTRHNSIKSNKKLKSIDTVILDPGHGFTDPGAKGYDNSYEKDKNYDFVKRLEKKLSKDYKVIITRNKNFKTKEMMEIEDKYNEYIKENTTYFQNNNNLTEKEKPIYEINLKRALIANNYNNAIFISIHYNSPGLNELTTNKKFSEKISLIENIIKDSNYIIDPKIKNKIKQKFEKFSFDNRGSSVFIYDKKNKKRINEKKRNEESVNLAALIIKEFQKNNIKMDKNIIGKLDITQLSELNCPGILIEVGYMTDPFIENNNDLIIQAISKSIKKYENSEVAKINLEKEILPKKYLKENKLIEIAKEDVKFKVDSNNLNENYLIINKNLYKNLVHSNSLLEIVKSKNYKLGIQLEEINNYSNGANEAKVSLIKIYENNKIESVSLNKTEYKLINKVLYDICKIDKNKVKF